MMVVFSVERWRGRHPVMAAPLSACGMIWKALHAAAEAGDFCLWASINLIVYEFRGNCCGKSTDLFFLQTDLFHYKP